MNDEVHDAESNDPFELILTPNESYESYDMSHTSHCVGFRTVQEAFDILSFFQNLIFQK